MQIPFTKQDLNNPEARTELEKFIRENVINNRHMNLFALGKHPRLAKYNFSLDLYLVRRPSRIPGEFRYDVFSKHDLLGAGAFGQVYDIAIELKEKKGVFEYRQPPKVVKLIMKPPTNTYKAWQAEIKNETQIFKDIHQNKAHLAFEGTSAAVVMKKLEGHGLNKILRNKNLNLAERVIIANRLVDALMDFHYKDYVHSDFKAENTLVSLKSKKAALTDFGFTVKTGTRKVARGTPLFVAPELINNKEPDFKYTKAVDKYALAGTLAELFNATNIAKYKDNNLEKEYCLDGLMTFKDPYKKNNMIEEIVKGLSHSDPSKRMDLIEVKHKLRFMEEYCLQTSADNLIDCAVSIRQALKLNTNPAKKQIIDNIVNQVNSVIKTMQVDFNQKKLTWEAYEKNYLVVQQIVKDLSAQKDLLAGFRGISPKRIFNALTRPVSFILGALFGNEKWVNQGFVENATLKATRRSQEKFATFNQQFFNRYSSREFEVPKEEGPQPPPIAPTA